MRNYTLEKAFTKSRMTFMYDLKHKWGVHFHIYKKHAKSNQGELEEKNFTVFSGKHSVSR